MGSHRGARSGRQLPVSRLFKAASTLGRTTRLPISCVGSDRRTDDLPTRSMRTGGTIAVSAGGDERAAGDAVGSGPLTVGEMHVRAGASTVIPGGDDESVAAADMTSKKGANMTERVPVPSSEHVAEIVGRQGE